MSNDDLIARLCDDHSVKNWMEADHQRHEAADALSAQAATMQSLRGEIIGLEKLNDCLRETKEAQAAELEAMRERLDFHVAFTREAQDLGMAAQRQVREQARELEALRADAERYRWLRDEDDDPCLSLVDLFTTTGKREDVDAAIDAAMQSGKANTK